MKEANACVSSDKSGYGGPSEACFFSFVLCRRDQALRLVRPGVGPLTDPGRARLLLAAAIPGKSRTPCGFTLNVDATSCQGREGELSTSGPEGGPVEGVGETSESRDGTLALPRSLLLIEHRSPPCTPPLMMEPRQHELEGRTRGGEPEEGKVAVAQKWGPRFTFEHGGQRHLMQGEWFIALGQNKMRHEGLGL